MGIGKQDGHKLAVRHNVDTFKILSNLGARLENFGAYEVRIPETFHGVYELMKHQEETAVFVSQEPESVC